VIFWLVTAVMLLVLFYRGYLRYRWFQAGCPPRSPLAHWTRRIWSVLFIAYAVWVLTIWFKTWR